MRKIKTVLIFLLLTGVLYAQQPPFYDEVQQIKKKDSLRHPKEVKSIFFIGSSSFTLWNDVQDYFPNHRITNYAFGGATLLDLIRYMDDIIPQYHTKQIVIYCGENDLASSDTISSKIVLQRFISLFTKIRKKFPYVPVVYVSMKPSPSRELLLPKMIKGNALIKKYLATKKRTAYVDVYKEMIDDEGKPRSELFLDDNLHMNKTGYAIWQKLIEPHLLKE